MTSNRVLTELETLRSTWDGRDATPNNGELELRLSALLKLTQDLALIVRELQQINEDRDSWDREQRERE